MTKIGSNLLAPWSRFKYNKFPVGTRTVSILKRKEEENMNEEEYQLALNLNLPHWIDALLTSAIGAVDTQAKDYAHTQLTNLYKAAKVKAQTTDAEWDDAAVEAVFGAFEGWKKPSE